MTERQRQLNRERRWELYRRSVVERMPDSEYKTAVLAGVEHKLNMLDRIETFHRRSSEKPGQTGLTGAAGLRKLQAMAGR